MSVDVEEKTIYVIGLKVSDSSSLLQVDYEDSSFIELYTGDAITSFTYNRALDVFNGTAVWIERKANTSDIDVEALDVFNGTAVWIDDKADTSEYVVYSCKLSPTCQEVHTLYQSKKVIILQKTTLMTGHSGG